MPRQHLPNLYTGSSKLFIGSTSVKYSRCLGFNALKGQGRGREIQRNQEEIFTKKWRIQSHLTVYHIMGIGLPNCGGLY